MKATAAVSAAMGAAPQKFQRMFYLHEQKMFVVYSTAPQTRDTRRLDLMQAVVYHGVLSLAARYR